MYLMQHKYNAFHVKFESFIIIHCMYLQLIQFCVIAHHTLQVIQEDPDII